jgi:hypothetical protein
MMQPEEKLKNRSVTLTAKTEERVNWLMGDMDMPSLSQLVRTAVDRLFEERSQLRLRNPEKPRNNTEHV